MLTEETMKSIKAVAEATYVFGILNKNEARQILLNKLGMKHVQFLDDGTIYVIDAQGQDAYLQFPLLTAESEKKAKAI